MYKWRQIKVIKPLSSLEQDQSGVIIQVRGKPAVHRYLCGMGIFVGCNIVLCRETTGVDGSSLSLRIGNRLVSLEKSAALNIKVQVPVSLAEKEVPSLTHEYAGIRLLHR